jgi:phospholipid/cholesterol/gamma-HCH transport system permease protein
VLNRILQAIERSGQFSLFMLRVAGTVPSIWSQRKETMRHAVFIGVQAIPVVMLASAFSGIVMTIQVGYQLVSTPVLPPETLGAVVGPSLMLEMCALIPGLVMASRVGAAIAASLGTMRVTEQIDALDAMGIDPVSYLVTPRIAAATLTFPVLYVASCVTGILFGGMAGDVMGYSTFEYFIAGAQRYFLPFDPMYGMLKSLAFGFLIAAIACWKGFSTTGGADGVGRAATEAVVASCVNILIADYVLAEILL